MSLNPHRRDQGRGGSITMKCGKCRRPDFFNGSVKVMTPTGRFKENARTSFGAATKYEYRCPWCGNVGWTLHSHVQERFLRLPAPAIGPTEIGGEPRSTPRGDA